MIDQRTNTLPKRTSNLTIWPLILITAGAILLLGNFGLLRWVHLPDLRYLLPLLLVAFGVDVMLKGRFRLFVFLGTVAAALALSTGMAAKLGVAAVPQLEVVSQGLEGAERAEVKLSGGVAALTLRGDEQADLLASATIQPLRGERIDTSFAVNDGVARLEVDSEGRVLGGLFAGDQDGYWDFALTGRVPLTLDISAGVGESVLDLSELQLESLDISTGVGATRVTLPSSGEFDASIETGIGAVSIMIPRNLAARIAVSKGVGEVSVADAFERSGDRYLSPDYATTADRVDIRISAGVGAVNVVVID